MPKFPSKPPAPSVRSTIGEAVGRSWALAKDERPLPQREVVRDTIAKLELPVSLKKRLRERHGLDE